MNNFKFLILLFIGLIALLSCKEDDPIKKSELGFIKTAVVNDENNDDFAQIGETITYTFTVTNTGDFSISQLNIRDDKIGVFHLPTNPDTLAPNESVSITINYTITILDSEFGKIVNQATVSGVDTKGEVIRDLSDDDSNEEDDETITNFDSNNGAYENGFFVLNEGSFGAGNASITFVHEDFSLVEQEIFKTVNGRPLGDTAQSIYILEEKAYIIVNGSNKIEVVNRFTMESIATIEGSAIKNPRYMVVHDGFGYISTWGEGSNPYDDKIVVINLYSNSISDTFWSRGEGPEKMLVKGSRLYVNHQGGWGQSNIVAVFDAPAYTYFGNFYVGDAPNSIVKDSNGDIWVLCGGNPYFATQETPGRLVKIENNSITFTYDFSEIEHPNHLLIDGDYLYYLLDGKVFKWDSTTNNLPTEEEYGLDGNYYNMNISDGLLFTTDAGDYMSEGTLKVFDLENNELIQTITTGIIPNAIVFP